MDSIIDAPGVQNPVTILLMGLRRSGKSSICKVVFHNVQPLDTLYLESTTKPTTENFKSLIDLAVVELPGQLNMFEPSLYDSKKLFSSIGALVYVIDSQDEYLSALQNLAVIIKYAVSVNPKIHIEVLIHKVDGLSEDYRLDTQRDIMQRVGDDLLDYGLEGVQISFYLTSIFDHSIYEAFSRIVQKLIYELPALENMLDLLMQYSNFDKVFLFDVNSKIYVATDSSPVDIQTYEVCAEFIDVTIDLDGLYEPPRKIDGPDSVALGARNSSVQSSSQFTSPNSIVPETKNSELDPIYVAKPTRCISKLQNGTTLYLYQMIRGLALVGVSRLEEGDEATSITVIDHNVNIFKKSLEKMWEKSRVK
ncbi:GTP-binding protein gtr2 [Brettanomyces bruxellensis]|uniref:GTP-binding protein n=1 Tax=Dekkera bruxellensis TaxID=5007 RepID=A0A8H6B7U2_DEKBR|nr:GTP-binding protein gtr2 [Brettanomyces bruxellensis]KAF6006713.1 GTP-binding protein gtr2 [Brettanomyces bruxellensis]